MRRRGMLAALMLAGLGLGALPAVAARKPVVESAASAPAWVREAATRGVPGDLGGVESLVLHDEWIVQPLPEGGVRTTHRLVQKILKPEGLGDAGTAVVSYGSEDRVERVDAWNVLPGGSMRRPHAKDDLRDFPVTAGGSTVDDVRLRTADVPGIAVGSIVGSETVVVRGIDRGAFQASFGSVDAPTGTCRVTLEAPAGWTVSDHASRAGSFTRSASDAGITWTATSLAPPPREEWAPQDEERLPLIWVRWSSPDGKRGFADWDAVARWYRELADPVLKECGEASAVSLKLKPADAAAFSASLRDAFAFTSRDVRYVAIEMGIGGYKPQTPAFTCSNRYGDCKAKAFLMRSIVEPWGWQAFPVIVRTSDAGKVVPEVPTPGQFNHCIVGLKLPEGLGSDAWNVKHVEGVGRVAFLDPTTESLGPWQLRPDDQGTLALLVLPEGGRIVELPVQPPEAAVVEIEAEAALDDGGQVVTGSMSQRFTGTNAGSVRSWLGRLSAERRTAAAAARLQSLVPGATVVTDAAEGVESLDGDVVLKITFRGGRLGQRAGSMIIVQPPTLALPFAAARLPPPPRISELDLGLPEERRVRMTIHAPEGWKPESLPPPSRRESADLSIDCSWEATDRGFVMRGTGRQLVRTVSPERYAEFRDTALRANSIESEGVVLVPAG